MTTESNIPVNTNQIDPAVEEFCRSGLTCQLGGVVSDLWVLIVVGLAIGTVIASVAYLKSARSELEEDQSRTASERDAFMEFGRRVSDLPAEVTEPAGIPAGGTASAIGTTQGSDTAMDKVQQAYRETVMAVPHYEEEYGESLRENMTIEFGEDFAASVGAGSQFTPVVQQVLVAKTREATVERSRLIKAHRREDESLAKAEDTFSKLQSTLMRYHPDKLRQASYQTLIERWDELDSLENQCSDAVDARQRRLQTEPIDQGGPTNAPAFVEYLYGALDVDYPVLATGASFLEQIRTSRQTIATIAANRR